MFSFCFLINVYIYMHLPFFSFIEKNFLIFDFFVSLADPDSPLRNILDEGNLPVIITLLFSSSILTFYFIYL